MAKNYILRGEAPGSLLKVDGSYLLLIDTTGDGLAVASEYQAWKGAVEPAASAATGNEYQAWKGAVEPAVVAVLAFVRNLARPLARDLARDLAG